MQLTLIRSSGSTLERIESNGIVFGVLPDPDYPVCEIPISPGDRFLLYTDGVIEPENASGEFFGNHKPERGSREGDRWTRFPEDARALFASADPGEESGCRDAVLAVAPPSNYRRGQGPERADHYAGSKLR